MSRGATIFLLAAAIALALFVAIFVPLQKDGGKPAGTALFDFDPDDISLITITNGDEVIELRRTDEGWMIGPGLKDRASVDAVRRLMETARGTLIIDRIDAGEIGDRDKLSEYGLKKSRVQFDFRGDRDLPLLVGKDAVDETRSYVRFEDSRDVYLIPDDLVNLILSPPQDFRDRMPFRVSPARVDRIVIRHPSGEIELKREASGWRIIKPLSARASTSAIESLLEKLARIRLEGFEPDTDPSAPGLSEPAVEVRLFGEGDPVPETIRIGTASPNGGVFARLEPRGVTVRLPSSITEILAVDLTSLRDLSLARINLDLVDLIRIATPSSKFVLKRQGDGWLIGDRRASAAAVQRMVDAFALVKCTGFESATGQGLEKNGLTTPAFVVGFYSVVSENTPESPAGEQLVCGLSFGSRREKGVLPAHITGSPEIAFVPEKILEAVPPEESAWRAP